MPIRDTDGTLFHFCPECGQPANHRSETPFFRCASCGFQLYFNIASAAGAFLRDRAGRLLFIRRAHEPARGKLGVPGGFVDPGEAIEEAVRREVLEEVGLSVARLDYFGSHPNRYEYQGVRYNTVDLFFRGEIESFADARRSGEVEEMVILHPGEVDPAEIAFDSMRWAFAALMAPARVSPATPTQR